MHVLAANWREKPGAGKITGWMIAPRPRRASPNRSGAGRFAAMPRAPAGQLCYGGAMTAPPDHSPSPPDDPLDALLLGVASPEWVKVAVFIARVVDAARAHGIEATGQAIAARLYVLVEAGRIAAQGNVRRWRAGEVRQVAS